MNMNNRGSDESETTRSTTASVTRPSDDVRKRMEDVVAEMDQQARIGRFRLPPKFVQFYKSDTMFLFVRAVVGYAAAFVKVLAVEKELQHAVRHRQQRLDQELVIGVASSSADSVDTCQYRLDLASDLRARCAAEMAAAYSRLVLHCSNFENHKEDERFFESVYLFACSVAKLGVSALPVHWRQIEEELGFLFRGAQFSSTVKTHARSADAENVARHQMSSGSNYPGSNSSSEVKPLSGVWATVSGTGSAASGGTIGSSAATGAPTISGSSVIANINNMFAKILNQTPAPSGASPTRVEVSSGGNAASSSAVDAFELPKSRISSFPESVPVKKIVSELEATKSRATRNMEVAQGIRDQIAAQRSEEQRRRLDAVASPRQLMRTNRDPSHLPALSTPSPPPPGSSPSNSATSARRVLLSPRISMKTTFTTRSPALNHLLPTTEERVRIALESYERELQDRRQQQILQVARQTSPGRKPSHTPSSNGDTATRLERANQTRSLSA